jgi:hypothetical protein
MTGRCRDKDSTHWLSMQSTHPILVEPFPADVSRDEGASCAMFAALANRAEGSDWAAATFQLSSRP